MTWNNFILLVIIGYAVYYGFNIVFDLLRASRPVPGDETEALAFEETFEPTVVDSDGYSHEERDTVAGTDSGKISAGTNEIKKEEQSNVENDDMEMDIQIEPVYIETVVQNPISGGVSYSDLFKLCREKAIVESTKFNFGY